MLEFIKNRFILLLIAFIILFSFIRSNFMKTDSIAAVAGHSGGHILPALTLLKKKLLLKKDLKNPKVNLENSQLSLEPNAKLEQQTNLDLNSKLSLENNLEHLKTNIKETNIKGDNIKKNNLVDESLKDNNFNTLFFSTSSELDQTILNKNRFIDKFVALDLANVPGKNIFLYPKFIFNFSWAFCKSFANLLYYRPKLILTTGGYISVPVCLAAWVLNIPIELYELNVIPGKASKLISRFAEKINICFPETSKYFSNNQDNKSNIVLSDYPIRFTKDNLLISQEKAKELLGFNPNKKVIFILGGSQGSQFINNLVLDYLNNNFNNFNNIEIIHQTNKEDLDNLKEFYNNKNIKALVFNYKDDLSLCYSASDIIVSRAGAGALAEILFFKKPAIIIPLETKANTHQVDNAKSVKSSYPEQIELLEQNILEKNNKRFFDLLNSKIL